MLDFKPVEQLLCHPLYPREHHSVSWRLGLVAQLVLPQQSILSQHSSPLFQMQLFTSSLRLQGTSRSSNSMHESFARVSKLIPGLTSGQACVRPSVKPVRQYFPQGHLVMEKFPALAKSGVLPMCPPFCLLSSHCPASDASGSVPWRSLM